MAAYFTTLALFVTWIALNPSEFWALLGTLLFTVASAFIAMFRFSKDLERSAREQVFSLREATQLQVREAERHAQEYVQALRESSERETRALESEIGKTVSRLDDLSLKLEAFSRAIMDLGVETMKLEKERVKRAEEALTIDRERLTVQEELQKAELGRAEADVRAREAQRTRLTPEVFLRIGERSYFLWMKDFWVLARLTAPVEELRVTSRPVRVESGRAGKWSQQVYRQPSHDKELLVVKLGDIGVRGVYDGAEIVIDTLTRDFRKFRGHATLLLSQTSWVETPLELLS